MCTIAAVEGGATGIDQGWAYKCMVEWAYEVVRLKESIEAPSRLHSLFMFANLEDAIVFARAENKIAVFSGEPDQPGSLRGNYDYSLYYVRHESLTVDAASFGGAWTAACSTASRYWSGEVTSGPLETLISGDVILDPKPVWRADLTG